MHFLVTDIFIGMFSETFCSIFACLQQGWFHYGISVFDRFLWIQVKMKMRGKQKTIDLSNKKSVTLKMCSFPGELKG